MSTQYRHYIPMEPRVKGFPFSFLVDDKNTQGVTPHTTINFETDANKDLMEELQMALQTVFEFHKYLDQDSEYYLPKLKDPRQAPVYYVGVNVIKEVEEIVVKTIRGEKKSTKQKAKHMVNNFVVKCYGFESNYSYTMVKSVDHLKHILEGATVLTYDVETSGLDPEFDIISGVNFATNKDIYSGYYIPLNHAVPYNTQNLPMEAFDIFYEAMVAADKVYMFNARFDMRNAEFLDYTMNTKTHNITNIKYDMSKVNFIDTYLTCYFSDPGWNRRNMDFYEKHFLGFYRYDLQNVLRLYGRDDFNTSVLDPKNLLFYAGQDAVTTMHLGLKTEKYLHEFGLSGEIDMMITYPLMHMENRLIRIDTEYVETEFLKIDKRLTELEELITKSIGKEINLNSSTQKVKLFESFGLDTGKKTKGGAMSVSRDAVDDMIEKLDKAGKSYPTFLKYLGEQSKLQQLKSTFFGSLKEQMYHRDGRVRLNYRHGNTATGRFSSGKEEF